MDDHKSEIPHTIFLPQEDAGISAHAPLCLVDTPSIASILMLHSTLSPSSYEPYFLKASTFLTYSSTVQRDRSYVEP